MTFLLLDSGRWNIKMHDTTYCRFNAHFSNNGYMLCIRFNNIVVCHKTMMFATFL